MRALALSTLIYFGAWVAQTVAVADTANTFAIIDKYGFPTAVAAVMFVYFNRQLSKSNSDKDGYRKETVDLLKGLLSEAKATKAFCKFEAVRHEVNKNG